jgi:hypothetical protein
VLSSAQPNRVSLVTANYQPTSIRGPTICSSGRHRKVVLTEPAKVHLLKCKVCSKRRRIDSEAHSKASASSAPVAAVLVEVVSVEEEAEEGAGKISRLMVVEPASSKGGVVPSDDYQIRFQKRPRNSTA